MNVTFYNNSSENIKIGKSLTAYGTYSVTLKEACSIKNPILKIEIATVPNVNYAYIPDFGRYYFVKDPICIRNGLWEIPLQVDVLESFKSGILNCDAILNRQEFLYNMYLKDELLDGLSDTFTVTKRFSTGFDVQKFVLTTQSS